MHLRNTLAFLTPLVALLGLSTLAGLAGCAATVERDGVRELIVRGEFEAAVERAAKLHDKHPDNAEYADLHRRATVAWLLDHGRRLTFEDRDEPALALFAQAYELAPESPQARSWFDKSRRKLGLSNYHYARELHAEDQLVPAMEAYQRALAFDGSLSMAREGLARVFVQLNYRDGLAQDYYNEGVRNLRQYLLDISRSRFDYSTKYRPGDERAETRRDQVERLLARERVSVARSLEEEGLFAAAEKDYEIALRLDPELEEAQAGKARAGLEAEATRIADRASMMVLREEFDLARETLQQGLAITQLQTERFETELASIEEAAIEAQYQHARDLEHDFRYEDAIGAYRDLLERVDWYADVRSRIATLEEYVARAPELYRLAEEASAPEHEAFYLRQIELFWPEYRDLPQKLEALDGVRALAPDADLPAEDEPEEEITPPAEEGGEPAEPPDDDGR